MSRHLTLESSAGEFVRLLLAGLGHGNETKVSEFDKHCSAKKFDRISVK